MTTDLTELVPDLKTRREQLGLSLSEVARRAGVTPSNVKAWEDRKWVPQSDMLFAWCGALGLGIKVVTAPVTTRPPSLARIKMRTTRGIDEAHYA